MTIPTLLHAPPPALRRRRAPAAPTSAHRDPYGRSSGRRETRRGRGSPSSARSPPRPHRRIGDVARGPAPPAAPPHRDRARRAWSSGPPATCRALRPRRPPCRRPRRARRGPALAAISLPSAMNNVPNSGPDAPPTVITSLVPIAFSASGSGFSAIASASARTASKPRFMLSPWSPSPIAWSSAVSSSACATMCRRRPSISVFRSIFVIVSHAHHSRSCCRRRRRTAAPGSGSHRVALPESALRVGQRHQLSVADRQVQVVLVAEMLDPVDGPSAWPLADLRDRQMLGAGADRGRAGRRLGIGQQPGAAAG